MLFLHKHLVLRKLREQLRRKLSYPVKQIHPDRKIRPKYHCPAAVNEQFLDLIAFGVPPCCAFDQRDTCRYTGLNIPPHSTRYREINSDVRSSQLRGKIRSGEPGIIVVDNNDYLMSLFFG